MSVRLTLNKYNYGDLHVLYYTRKILLSLFGQFIHVGNSEV